jgi:hypothetical protein
MHFESMMKSARAVTIYLRELSELSRRPAYSHTPCMMHTQYPRVKNSRHARRDESELTIHSPERGPNL